MPNWQVKHSRRLLALKLQWTETCGPVELAKVKGSKVSQEPTAEADSLSDPEGYVESNVWKLRLNVLGDLGGSLSFRVIKFG